MIRHLLPALLCLPLAAEQTGYIAFGRFVALTPETSPRTETIRYYRTESGVRVGVLPQILVKLREGGAIDPLVSLTGALRSEELAPRLHLLYFTEDVEILALAVSLADHPDVLFAQPNLRTPKELR